MKLRNDVSVFLPSGFALAGDDTQLIDYSFLVAAA
jgi:hypothetical protein